MLTPALLLGLLALLQASQAPAENAGAGPPKMIPYQLVMLKPGPSYPSAGTPEGQATLKEHAAHLHKLGADGVSVAAGPFLDDGDIQGVLIVKAPTPAEARQVENADPAVKAGIFTVEVASFLSPDGLFGKWAESGKFETVFFGFLNSGPDRGQDPETAKRLQAEHLAYMRAQADQGKLVVAGPFTESGTRRGVVVYRVGSAEEARSRAEGDPMVKAGRLAVELHPWQVPQGALPAPK